MLVLLLVEMYVIAICTLLYVLYKLVLAYKRYRYRDRQSAISNEELPAVSVCIPARNETNSMTECLESVLASDYPKMEILVLDDASSDNTSHLIKAFAHAGVRFVPGEALPDDWLGKNYALETLLEESSGRYVIFMDVDTRLSPDSIRRIIEEMISNKASMVAVIPQRKDTFRASTWFSTLRYFWELILDNKYLPGSSSTWVINRKILSDELGGFGIWRDEVQPETKIASELAKTGEYKLILSTTKLGVNFDKKWSSQIETGRRLLLPRFHNSMVSTMLGVSLLMTIIFPQVVIIYALFQQWWGLVYAEIIIGLLATLLFGFYCKMVWVNKWWIGCLVAPFVAWQEFFLLISSAVGYQRQTITWKGRKVSRPSRKNIAIS